jgi:hypothetical protein
MKRTSMQDLLTAAQRVEFDELPSLPVDKRGEAFLASGSSGTAVS